MDEKHAIWWLDAIQIWLRGIFTPIFSDFPHMVPVEEDHAMHQRPSAFRICRINSADVLTWVDRFNETDPGSTPLGKADAKGDLTSQRCAEIHTAFDPESLRLPVGPEGLEVVLDQLVCLVRGRTGPANGLGMDDREAGGELLP